jgi:hypothetical protein
MIEPAVAVRRLPLIVALLAAGAPAADASGFPPVLDTLHTSPSGAFSFRTPRGWTIAERAAEPETVDAAGSGVRVRIVYRAGEHGFDSLHGTCMLERLSAPENVSPEIKYEYDFMGGAFGDRRALDSAFLVKYDTPVFGYKQWRQRNLTVVGAGSSLCAISFAPVPVWKKSRETRELLDAVLGSVNVK